MFAAINFGEKMAVLQSVWTPLAGATLGLQLEDDGR